MTVDVPDRLFRRAKAAAAQHGISLKEFFTLALREHVWRQSVAASPGKPWMKSFGGMRELHAENKRIEQRIAREFERTDDEEWR